MKALAADPKDRYASAEALRAALVRRPRVWPRAAVATVLTLGVLALGAAVLAPWRSSGQPAPPPLAGAPLDGRLEVLAFTPEEMVKALKLSTQKMRNPITQDGVLPLRRGEQVRLVAELDQPAYVYLVWVDGQGKATALYSSQPVPVSWLAWPGESEVRALKGPAGRETAVLLARRTPLPPGTRVEDLLKDLPAPTTGSGPDLEEVRVVDGREVPGTSGWTRGLDETSQVPDDPLSQLVARLRPHFDLIHAYRFAYEGGGP
jgi:hypothetical protein